jgi:hypothetical protein
VSEKALHDASGREADIYLSSTKEAPADCSGMPVVSDTTLHLVTHFEMRLASPAASFHQ